MRIFHVCFIILTGGANFASPPAFLSCLLCSSPLPPNNSHLSYYHLPPSSLLTFPSLASRGEALFPQKIPNTNMSGRVAQLPEDELSYSCNVRALLYYEPSSSSYTLESIDVAASVRKRKDIDSIWRTISKHLFFNVDSD